MFAAELSGSRTECETCVSVRNVCSERKSRKGSGTNSSYFHLMPRLPDEVVAAQTLLHMSSPNFLRRASQHWPQHEIRTCTYSTRRLSAIRIDIHFGGNDAHVGLDRSYGIVCGDGLRFLRFDIFLPPMNESHLNHKGKRSKISSCFLHPLRSCLETSFLRTDTAVPLFAFALVLTSQRDCFPS